MALLVGCLVEAEGLYPVGGVGHNGLGAAIVEPMSQLGTVVGLVAEKPFGGLCAPDEALSRRTIVRLAAGQEDGKKTAFSI
jgi:hypothetical protein